MENSTRFATIRKAAALLAISAILFSTACSEGTTNEEAPKGPAIEEIVGAWEADGYRWILEGKSTLYLLDDNTDDGFARDENGKYIIITAREYCEQYAKDYNADPANGIKGTAEDFANHPFENTPCMTNIAITDQQITIWGGIMSDVVAVSRSVYGKYTYDQQTGILTVADVAIANDPRSLQIAVRKDADGYMNFQYTDLDKFNIPSYDKVNYYYTVVPMVFYCRPGTAYHPPIN